VEGLLHGAGFGGADEALADFDRHARRHGDVDLEPGDAAGRSGRHMLGDGRAGAAEIEPRISRVDAEDREEARRHGGGGEIGRRETFALALVVDGRVGHDHVPRGSVHGADVEVTEVFAGDVDGHAGS
jgi:hypothetical protein